MMTLLYNIWVGGTVYFNPSLMEYFYIQPFPYVVQSRKFVPIYKLYF